MAQVTWLGEGPDGPQECWLGGKQFKLGEAVEVDDHEADLIDKARGNKFFTVTGAAAPTEPLKYPAPTEMSAQGEAPKPGEPIRDPPGTAVPSKPIPKF